MAVTFRTTTKSQNPHWCPQEKDTGSPSACLWMKRTTVKVNFVVGTKLCNEDVPVPVRLFLRPASTVPYLLPTPNNSRKLSSTRDERWHSKSYELIRTLVYSREPTSGVQIVAPWRFEFFIIQVPPRKRYENIQEEGVIFSRCTTVAIEFENFKRLQNYGLQIDRVVT